MGTPAALRRAIPWRDQARQLSLPISTLGIGNDFNEDLLIPLADLTGGRAYYIENPEQMPTAFDYELGAARAVRFRNLEIKLRFPGGGRTGPGIPCLA